MPATQRSYAENLSRSPMRGCGAEPRGTTPDVPLHADRLGDGHRTGLAVEEALAPLDQGEVGHDHPGEGGEEPARQGLEA